MAKIIVFEGPDKAGKQTQSNLLRDAFEKDRKKVALVEVPAAQCKNTYKLIYWMLKNGLAKKLPNVFQFIQFLNKWFFQRNVLPDLLKLNDYVIFDRWSLSAVIYGNATGVNVPFNMWLYNRLRKPDVTIVMANKSFRRSTTTDDSYEKDSSLQARVREDYIEWSLNNSDDHVLVNNEQPIDVVHGNVLKALSSAKVIDE